MGAICNSNLDDDVISDLKSQAKRNRRTFDEEIRFLLTASVSRCSRLKCFREHAKRVAEFTASSQRTDSADLIREDRDR